MGKVQEKLARKAGAKSLSDDAPPLVSDGKKGEELVVEAEKIVAEAAESPPDPAEDGAESTE